MELVDDEIPEICPNNTKDAVRLMKEISNIKSSLALEIIAACLLIFLTISNISTVYKKIKIPDEFKWINPTLGLTQKWGMFASPLSSVGWYIFSGTLSDRSNIYLNKR